ncbi:class I SAM-dependent methyltransferase [uncultured Jatrophihabitans sp.]|uniref:class I SAM-dependent methyltransferase n=1 Tax=uncultured Jatrophihabitans sp. TaxID=1610747 RepID=UPI0035C98B4E
MSEQKTDDQRSDGAGDTDYTAAAAAYERFRRPDPRIAEVLHRQLGEARTVLNVGAGTGSYEPRDRYVLAVEPSAAMRARRAPDAVVPAVDAAAEALPFDDGAVDAAMAVFTVHQWPDVGRGLRELRRVAAGPVVVMTLDIDALPDFWLGRYLPERLAAEQRRFPPLADLATALGGHVEITPVPIPLDCSDGFLEAYYGRPEALLDQRVRAAQSGWQFVDPAAAERGLGRLATDLDSGSWDRSHGALRTQPSYTGPLVLVTSRTEAP